MTEKIDKILTLLQDGQWHPIKEITQKTKLNQTKIQLITDFLTKYNLIKLNKTQQEAKLTPPTQKLIKKIQKTSNKKQKMPTSNATPYIPSHDQHRAS